MASENIQKLLQRSKGEKFEDALESGVKKTRTRAKEMYQWGRGHPVHATLYAGGVVGLWLTLQFGIPWAINKYHETKASNDIDSAQEQLVNLGRTQENVFSHLNAQRFIIPDAHEKRLDDQLGAAGERAVQFNKEIGESKELFEQKRFKEVRAKMETDEGHVGAGLIDIIKAEIPPLEAISIYAVDLRSKRDTSLSNESTLSAETTFSNAGFNEPHLQNAMGRRLASSEPTLETILRIAKRPGVKDHGNGLYDTARRSFISAASGFSADDFVHYSTKQDNTYDTENYNLVLGKQDTLFSHIRHGDAKLGELGPYLNKLREQWYTVVAKRWEDSHQESYVVQVDNPSYREWTDRECHQVCTPTYDDDRMCRNKANSDGTVDEECVTVRTQGPDSCRDDCKNVTKDNGEPRRIPETRYKTIYEYWVRIETHRISGTTAAQEDLKNESLWRSSQYEKGYTVWKPYGDDTQYSGVGALGPYREQAHLVE